MVEAWAGSAGKDAVEAGTRGKDSDVDVDALSELIKAVQVGTVSADEAVSQLRRLPFADLGMARIDHHRQLRQGLVEAVYGPGKTPEQTKAVVAELLDGNDGPVILSRADEAQIETVLRAFPNGRLEGHTVVWRAMAPRDETVVVATAGTADLPVSTEAAVVLEALGFQPNRLVDVGVAGLHRLLREVDVIAEADAVVVVAGMEGALASVVGGIAAGPVIAVPTSVGYGAGLNGVTALLSMLASCAAGITVVGIDNGFGAAMAVARALNHFPKRTG